MSEALTGKTLSPFAATLGELIKGEVHTVPAEEPVVEVARRMRRDGVGSLVVLEAGEPVGIVTKTDMVCRVLASGVDPQTPVSGVLTRNLVTIEKHRPIFDGLLLMIRNNIGHLVVTEKGRLAGMVSERDWLTFQERHPAALIRHFDTARTVPEVAALRVKAAGLIRRLFGEEGTAEALTHLVTEINDRVTRRVIDLCLAGLVEEGFGERPVPFAWIAMGSEGRGEQTLSTDQDNGLVFQDVPEAETEAVRQWFLRLAARVVDGLEICGFPRCKGNIMASNPDLCLPLTAWQTKFANILQQADPEALLRASIYFDARCLYGDAALVDALWEDLLERVVDRKGFLRHLAGLVLGGRPPVHTVSWRLRSLLGMDHPPLDLKKQGLAPLVSSVRVLALAARSKHTNTLERLEAAGQAGLMDDGMVRAVASAYDFLMLLRLRQHFRQEARGDQPSNAIVMEDLNPLRRRFFVEALNTVIYLQDHVYHQYGGITAM